MITIDNMDGVIVRKFSKAPKVSVGFNAGIGRVVLAIIKNIEFSENVYKSANDDRTLRIGYGRPLRASMQDEMRDLTIEAEKVWVTGMISSILGRIANANPGIQHDRLFLAGLASFKSQFAKRES